MITQPNVEYWLAGNIENIAPVLQPVAHAMLQSRREINEALHDFPETLLWQKPGGVAPVAFHLQHIPGFIDRLFTYASDQQLSNIQMAYLQDEGKEDPGITADLLVRRLNTGVEEAIEKLKTIPGNLVFETRWVGRKRIPSNVLGLLFHAAEHMQRHTGQLLVTAKVLRNSSK
jgi:hypothetical protein